ncbi:uncharacterized protein TRIVIDRAFT_66633 [Trichoderma virens Gv29-8]|uniref:RNase MRP protein 1 RNA binding domain-containing protein n=1 Tax=Hypocrea virens (strain Gv29-8 / FGSC 10586) TaxID=413071 RepID=G9N6H0_HYPVG|nr:uncharacterized protein TRIVIDRAFT_66633 [Trichoderma virens Gv29-8]EHK17730.1 hypothetical protein TRIVIDRAFT_66633 [Trichoderma virens Gv29-8]UKZ53555.1 hypothetical protein TrVGV298_007348 [Trichoderma virens]
MSSSASSATASLSPILPILNAFNHRHHNQHRLAHWWPVFRIFRRTIRALLDDLASRRRDASSSSPPPRAVWLSKHFIPRAYIAFSQLAADNQHAPLGLLLLAILSRTHTVLTQLLDQPSVPLKSSTARSNEASQDKGVAIARQEQQPPKTQTTTQPPSDEGQSNKLDRDAIKPSKSKSKEIPTKEKKKKKKGKGDELSSLFGSLS